MESTVSRNKSPSSFVSLIMDVVDERNNVDWPAGLESLYVAERSGFVRLAYLMTGRRDIAEEIVQDAFMSCAPRWQEIERPKAYVRTAVANGSRNWLRRTKLDKERAPRALEPNFMAPDELWDALERLDERRRIAIVLRYYDDLPDSEIAEALGCRQSTVRSLIHRAINDLRREVKR